MAYRRRQQQQQDVTDLPSSGRASSNVRVQSDEEEISKVWSWDDDDDDNNDREDIVDDDESTSPSLAAKAIRASSAAQRDSSLSSAYAAHPSYIRRPSSDATPSPKYSPMTPKMTSEMQDSSPSNYQYTSMKNLSDSKTGGFWNSLARKAKSILDDDIHSPKSASSIPGTAGDEASQLPKRGGHREHAKHFQSPEMQHRSDGAAFHKGFGVIASSLTHISGKVGNALEEGFSIVENRAADIIQETRKLQARRKFGTTGMNEQGRSDDSQFRKSELQISTQPQTESDMEIQLKASRDVRWQPCNTGYMMSDIVFLAAIDYEFSLPRPLNSQVSMAMAAKTKVLLRELKTVKADFAFAKERCAQLEEENRVLRDSMENGDNPEDDDLIRLQLETLLAEKARLAHENSVYARENRFLREIVEYHQLTMQDVVYLDENNEEVSQVYPPMGSMRSLSSSTRSFSTSADIHDDDSFSTHA